LWLVRKQKDTSYGWPVFAKQDLFSKPRFCRGHHFLDESGRNVRFDSLRRPNCWASFDTCRSSAPTGCLQGRVLTAAPGPFALAGHSMGGSASVCTWLLSGPASVYFVGGVGSVSPPKPSRSITNHSKHYDYEHNNTPHDALILKHFPELPFAEFLSPVAQW
jgi:hypothetical protein